MVRRGVRRRRKRRDTYFYELKLRKKVVYRGITKDPERRFREHIRSGKRFTHMLIYSYPRTRESARRLEKEALKSYERSHGRLPPYNKRK